MPLLFPRLVAAQVFGANTDVGKTLLTTSLLRSTSALYAQRDDHPSSSTSTSDDSIQNQSSQRGRRKRRVFYLKPVSTGPSSEADDSFVNRNAGQWKSYIDTKCLYQYREPVSPHLAAKLASDLAFPKSNEELLKGIAGYITDCARDVHGQTGSESITGVYGSVYLETAGGVHSPSLHPPLTQLDSLRPLLLPTILIASPHLGGISTTISAYESLKLRGYEIVAVLGLRDPYYRNHDFLQSYFQDRGVEFWGFDKPGERLQGEEDRMMLDEYYEKLETEGMGEVVKSLEEGHLKRIEELQSMPGRTLDKVWWPFTQHGIINKESDVMVIDSAKGDYFDAYYAPKEGKVDVVKTEQPKSLLNPLFDASASWFTQSHTHAHPDLTLAAASAAGRYGHVLFPSGTHAPALELTERLLSTVGKGWASRVFFSDNGSTGMEVALKMAIRASGVRYGWEGKEGMDVGVIGLRGGYHGDTIGSMDATDASIFNTATDWYKGRGHWFSPPVVTISNGQVTVSSTGPDHWPTHDSQKVAQSTDSSWSTTLPSLSDAYDVSSRLSSPLAEYYRSHIFSTLLQLNEEGRRFGALIIEPICLGAGGMVFVDPLFQRCLIDVVRSAAGKGVEGQREWKGLPVIFDEVFSGLHRLSYLTASTILGATPDISCYAKILTAGLLPLSTTLASSSIFNAFLHPTRKVDALLHGHSYTANPMACAVALKGLEMVESKRRETQGGWVDARAEWGLEPVAKGEVASGEDDVSLLWSFWGKDFVFEISKIKGVKGVMTMGTVFAMELEPVGKEVEEVNATGGGYAASIALDFLTSLRETSPIHVVDSTNTQTHDPSSTPFPFHIHSRPLGDVCYFMTSLWTTRDTVKAMERGIMEGLRRRAEKV